MDEENRIGWLLLLKKRRISLQNNDTQANTFQYLLFGNFDTLQVKPIVDWCDQLPDYRLDLDASGITLDDVGDYSFQKIPYASNYVLRALKPNCDTSGLSYPDYQVAYYKKPFFAIVLINYSHSICRGFDSGDKLTEWIVQQLAKCPAVLSGDVECGVYECLGFYDAILMIRSHSPKSLQSFCTYVRNLRYQNRAETGASCYAISSCYAVLGLQNLDAVPADCRAEYDLALQNAQSDIKQIHIHLQLQPGNMNTSHQSMFPDESTFLQALNGYKGVTVSVPGGKSANLFKQYFSDGSLNPEMRSETVLHADTQVYTDSELTPNEVVLEPKFPNDVFPFDQDFWKTYQDYVNHRKSEKRSLRLATALRQTVLRYQNLVANDYCFDLKELANPVFEALYQNMKHANNYLEFLAGRLRNLASSGASEEIDQIHAKLQSFWEVYDVVLKSFRDLVGRYISDLSLSVTHFIEDSHLKYPSVGTATKFIYAYHLLTRKLADCVNQENTKYQFLVKSGGQDEIYINNIFNDLWAAIDDPDFASEPPYVLLVIDVPERILYDLPSTVFSLVHEVFHFVGNRSRPLRAKWLTDAIAKHTAYYLTETYYWIYFQSESHYFLTLLQESERSRIIAGGKARYQKSIYRELKKELLSQVHDLSEKQLLSAPLTLFMMETCNALLIGSFQETIVRETYHSLLPAISELTKESELTDYPSRYIMAERAINDALSSGKELLPVLTDDSTANNLVNCIVSALLEVSYDIPDSFVPKIDREQFLAFLKQSIPVFLEYCLDAMCEGFSDIMAIRTLKLSWDDYIISLFSSCPEGNIYKLLPWTAKTILRLGCVLSAEFSIKKDGLTHKQQKQLINRLRGLAEEPEKLTARLNSMLKTCWSSYGSKGSGAMSSICTYLKKATNIQVDGIREAFQQESDRLRGFTDLKEEQAKKEHIMRCWLQLAKERYDDRWRY